MMSSIFSTGILLDGVDLLDEVLEYRSSKACLHSALFVSSDCPIMYGLLPHILALRRLYVLNQSSHRAHMRLFTHANFEEILRNDRWENEVFGARARVRCFWVDIFKS